MRSKPVRNDPPPPPRPAAVIFDLDGTLVDTVERRIQAWLAVFSEEGIPAARTRVAALIGSDGRMLARLVASESGMALDDDRTEAIDARAGALYEALERGSATAARRARRRGGSGPSWHPVGHWYLQPPGAGRDIRGSPRPGATAGDR